jgi:SAM-dependent methyltransferase
MFHLTESLVKGKPVGLNVFSGSGSTMYERLQKHPKLELIFHNCMSTQSKGVNDALAKIKELKKVKHLVDAGGADGTNAMLLHKLFPHMKITIFDLPTVCKIAKRNIAIHRLSHTIFVSPGNILRDQFPKGCDAILFCHVLPSYSPEKIQSVLKKCYDCLPKGGIVVLYQAMSFDDETGPLQPAAVSAYFVALVSGEGMIYPAKDFEEWLSSAGFSKVKRYVPLPKPGHGALVGIK